MKTLNGIFAIACVGMLAAQLHFAHGAPAVEGGAPLPEGVVPLTKAQLVSNVPHFYIFDYDGDPQPGKRYWVRVNDSTWVERYPDGFQSTFKVLGHAKVNDTEGTIVVKVSGSPRKTGT